MAQEIKDISDHVEVTVTQSVQVGLTLKEQTMLAASTERPGITSFVFAPLNAEGNFVQGQEKLKQFFDKPTCENPLLARLASMFQLLETTAKVNTDDPRVAAFVGYMKQAHGVDLTGLTLTEAVKVSYPIFDALNDAQTGAMPAAPAFVPLPNAAPNQDAPAE